MRIPKLPAQVRESRGTKRALPLYAVLLLAPSCRVATTEGGRAKEPPPEVSHQAGRLRCPLADQGPEFGWAADAWASQLRRTAVQALLRDSIEREKGEFARATRWCVFTNTAGWAVPAGVRALPNPAREEDFKPVPGCRALEVDPLNAYRAHCSFDGRPVEGISMMARWWPEPTERDAPSDGELHEYGVFAEPRTGQVLVMRYNLEP
jgi:hypothetical protein